MNAQPPAEILRLLHRERRRRDRHAFPQDGTCSVISLRKAQSIRVRFRDISSSGIGLVLPLWVAPGTFLVFKLASGIVPGPLRGRVVHATLHPNDSRWIIGCALTQEVDEALLERITHSNGHAARH